MLAAYGGKVSSDDALQRHSGPVGDSTEAQASSQPWRSARLEANFFHQGRHRPIYSKRFDSPAGRRHGLAAQSPTPGPSAGGHWTVVTGYEAKAADSQRSQRGEANRVVVGHRNLNGKAALNSAK